MSAPDPGDAGPVGRRPGAGGDESLLRGGVVGIAAVTLATLGLAAGGALISFLISLLY